MNQTEVLFPITNCGEQFSPDNTRRYALWRIWDRNLPLVMFIGLNPSMASDKKEDATIRSYIIISKQKGFGGFYIVNCWSQIATNSKMLIPDDDAWNDNIISELGKICKKVIFAWGNFEIVKKQKKDLEFATLFPNAWVLKINKKGSPNYAFHLERYSRMENIKRIR